VIRRRYTAEDHIASWKARYVLGACDLETLEWAIEHTLRDVDAGKWR
jgi:hypothetical protein